MLRLQLFLLITAVGGIFSNTFVESVLTDAELSLDRSVRILVSEMNMLKNRMEKMEQTHQETVEANRNLRTLVNSLTSKNGELERRVYSVEQFQRNRNRKDEFEDASDVLPSSENILNKSSVVELRELGPFENKMKSLSHGIHSKRKTRSADPVSASDGGVVAFSAQVMDPISNLGDNQVIPFKLELLDTHNAFHNATGIFTCPRAGLYAFFAKLLVYPDIRIEYAIAKNTDAYEYAQGYSKGVAPNKYDSGSAFGIINLAVGDKVWVNVIHDGHEGSGNQVFKWMSSFMGFSLN